MSLPRQQENPPLTTRKTRLALAALTGLIVLFTMAPLAGANGNEENNCKENESYDAVTFYSQCDRECVELENAATMKRNTYEHDYEDCDQGEIPVFPTAAASLAATTLGVLAYVGIRRRK